MSAGSSRRVGEDALRNSSLSWLARPMSPVLLVVRRESGGGFVLGSLDVCLLAVTQGDRDEE